MASPEMNRLIDHARVRLPGALDAAIQLELFAAMHEFLDNTNAWYEDIDFAVAASTLSYQESPGAYTFQIIPELGTPTRLLAVVNSAGLHQAATMATPGTIVLRHLPSTDDTYTARVALTVVDPVTREGYPQFPGWIIEKHFTTLLDGILGRMLSQTAKPYSAPQNALFHMRSFRAGVAQAKVEASRQNVYRGQSWRFPQTFNRARNAR